MQTAPDLASLVERARDGDILVLSGAGLSTESGIPDYRGPTGALRRSLPMTYQTFTREPGARQRYWARSQLGWRRFAQAPPNDGHRAVAELQSLGVLTGIVTQNVDGLHQAGGADGVIELHGSLDRVVCLDCGDRTPRAELDLRLRAANTEWEAVVTAVNPDGDVEVADASVEDFRIVDCAQCSGILKPDVVFFGENVPQMVVEHCYALVARSRTLLVLGSSLKVFSGLRFVRRAAQLGVRVVIVNQGVTRGDDQAQTLIDAPLGPTLRRLVEDLRARK